VNWIQRIKGWARALKRESLAMWFVARDPRTPWLARGLCIFVVAYALSPIDLIPDFIPVLGFVDDALLLPALIWLAIRMIPPQLLEASRVKADEWIASGQDKPRSRVGAVVIVVLWIAAAVGCWVWWRGWPL
jgi:uncharacterized membrane protein YkvA (DUF1232 family)